MTRPIPKSLSGGAQFAGFPPRSSAAGLQNSGESLASAELAQTAGPDLDGSGTPASQQVWKPEGSHGQNAERQWRRRYD